MPCLDWCNAWTCEEYEQGSCGACTACGGTEPQSEIVASSTAAGGGCLPWCSEWTCNKATDCGACAACMPNPPPPPLMPNSFLDNPFAALAGWYGKPDAAQQPAGAAPSPRRPRPPLPPPPLAPAQLAAHGMVLVGVAVGLLLFCRWHLGGGSGQGEELRRERRRSSRASKRRPRLAGAKRRLMNEADGDGEGAAEEDGEDGEE